MKKQLLIEITGALLILLFIYSGTSKLIEHGRFDFQLKLSPFLIIKNNSSLISWVIPLTEILISLALFYKKTMLIGLYSGIILLGCFEIYIACLFLNGEPIPCSCGGFISKMNWKGHLFFNAFFIIIAAIAVGKIRSNGNQNNTETFSRA